LNPVPVHSFEIKIAISTETPPSHPSHNLPYAKELFQDMTKRNLVKQHFGDAMIGFLSLIEARAENEVK
jgi:hypothetical protein